MTNDVDAEIQITLKKSTIRRSAVLSLVGAIGSIGNFIFWLFLYILKPNDYESLVWVFGSLLLFVVSIRYWYQLNKILKRPGWLVNTSKAKS
jgi:hypothetical protein